MPINDKQGQPNRADPEKPKPPARVCSALSWGPTRGIAAPECVELMIHHAPSTVATAIGNNRSSNPPAANTDADTEHRPAKPDFSNTGIKRNPQVSTPTVSRSKRVAQDRQRVMWDITQDKDLRGCHRWPISSEVAVVHSGEGVDGRFAGLQNSGSRWGSPMSARDIQHIMKVHLAIAAKNHLSAGGALLFLVNTVPHRFDQALAEVLNGLKVGMEAQTAGPKWRQDRDHYGIVHTFSDYEDTWGMNSGHHPHKNSVYFVECPLSTVELEALQASLFGRYAKGVVRAGLKAPHPEYGLSIQQVTTWGTDAAKVAAYCSKGGLGLVAEVTGTASKTAGEGRFTPGEMLDDMAAQKAETGAFNPVMVAAYREYEAEFKGLRSSWSRGAKKALGVDFVSKEDFAAMEAELFALADVELVERPDPKKSMAIAGIHRAEWRKIRSDFAAREMVTATCGLAETPEDAQILVGSVLDELGVKWVPRMVPMNVEDLDVEDGLLTHHEAFTRDLRKATLPT